MAMIIDNMGNRAWDTAHIKNYGVRQTDEDVWGLMIDGEIASVYISNENLDAGDAAHAVLKELITRIGNGESVIRLPDDRVNRNTEDEVRQFCSHANGGDPA